MAYKVKYAVYDRGVLMGQYYADEVAELIGIPQKRVYAYSASGARYQGRYTLEAVDDIDSGWAETWDRVRIEKLAWLRGGGAIGQGSAGAVQQPEGGISGSAGRDQKAGKTDQKDGDEPISGVRFRQGNKD